MPFPNLTSTWPAPPAPASPWAAHADLERIARANGTIARSRPATVKGDGTWVKISTPAPKPAAKPKPSPPTMAAAAPRHTDLMGVVTRFNLWHCRPHKLLCPEMRRQTGHDTAEVMIRPGAFDKSLSLAKVGEWTFGVQFWFGHDEARKTCSTCSATLRLWADREALYFYVSGGTSDGRRTVAAAKASGWNEMSLGMLITRYLWSPPSRPGAVGRVWVTEARLQEVSLVAVGNCADTRVTFL